MADLNSLPDTTIRHDPWSHANMQGQVVHCAVAEKQAGILQIGVEHNGDVPCLMAVSYSCSVAFSAMLTLNATFSKSNEVYQHLLNRYVNNTIREEGIDRYVAGRLRFWQSLSAITDGYDMDWYGAAGQMLTPFGPNGFTGQFVVVDPDENLILTITREDGAETDQLFGMNITWTGLDANSVSFSTPV